WQRRLSVLFRSLFTTLKICSGPETRRRPPARPRPVPGRLHVEPLEDRSLPSNYTFTDLGTLGGPTSYANDTNASGQIVGEATTAAGDSHAFLWNNGTMTDLGTFGGRSSYAVAINDVGQVVGSSTTAEEVTRAFLITPEDTDANGMPDRWFRD